MKAALRIGVMISHRARNVPPRVLPPRPQLPTVAWCPREPHGAIVSEEERHWSPICRRSRKGQ